MDSPYIVHIESAAAWCSVAVSEGNLLLSEAISRKPFDHAARITILIEQALAGAGVVRDQLDAISVSSGPGSYTGLRIGMAAGKGLAYGLNIPFIGVSTLELIAHQAAQLLSEENTPKYYIPMLDARRMEAYTAGYTDKLKEEVNPHAWIIDAESIQNWMKKDGIKCFCGDAAHKIYDFQSHIPEEVLVLDFQPLARGMVLPAYNRWIENNFLDLFLSTPSYVKNPYITKPKSRL